MQIGNALDNREPQAAALLEGEPGLASRYLCSLACHLALDWAGFEKARLSSAELLQLLETQPQWQPSMVFNFLMLPGYGHADYLALTRRLAHAMPSPKRYQYARPSARPDRLRVGYLSGDFKSHPCNQLACPVFERHDHKRFEWVAFDNSRDDASPARQRILAVFDRVVAVQGLGSVALAQAIRAGDAEIGLAGGVELMSAGGYLSPAMRSGARMGDSKMVDMMVAALTDPFGAGHMGMTAENQAEKWSISREEQDAFALVSQQRAAQAIAEGRFASQIVPITLKTRKGEVVFDTDEHLKRGTTMESLGKMKPAFKKDGTVTAGNASGINDAYERMLKSDVKYRFVIDMASLKS